MDDLFAPPAYAWQRLSPRYVSLRRLTTASAETDASTAGLDPDEAARLRDRLTELGEAQASGL